MKKIWTLMLAGLFMAGLLAGCGNQSAENSDQSGIASLEKNNDDVENATEAGSGKKAFKYGFISWGTADEHGRTLNAAVEWAVDAAGGEFVMDGSAISAETTVAAAENLIQSGCDMISFCTYAGEASVAQISKLCQENGVYWTMWDTTIADADIAAMIEKDPYYVGCTAEDNYSAGYHTLEKMVEAGAEKIIMFKYGVNIPTCDDRCEGAYAAAADLGAEIVYEVVAPEDWKKAAQDALVAYPEADGMFLAGSGTYTTSVAAACKETGKENFYIGAFDYFDQMGECLKNNELTVVNGGHMVTGTFSALLAINAFEGNPLSEEKIQVTIPYLTLASYEDYELYKEYASEGAAYTPEELQQCLKSCNPDLTLEVFQDFVGKWSIEDIKQRKTK